MLNDPTYVECACNLASEITREENGQLAIQNSLVSAFERVLQRAPSESEAQVLSSTYDDSIAYYQKHPKDTNQYLVAAGMSAISGDNSENARLAALSCVIQTLLNTDEFMTRE